jgi:hypothetical protein
LTKASSRLSELNGVIYGTTAYNYDKIIAKYNYFMEKKDFYVSEKNHLDIKDNRN